MKKFKHTRFEKARIIGARALQISMGAPILLEEIGPKDTLDPVKIAMKEFEAGVLPIVVLRERISGGRI